MSTVAAEHTWDRFRSYEKLWDADPTRAAGWIPFGYERQVCGCVVDRFSSDAVRRPCMAHEGEGHLAALSESDGLHVARCLVLVCGWVETHAWENDAIEAAQQHWRETRDS